MFRGAYSNHVGYMEKQNIDQLREMENINRGVVMERSRKVQQETIRRRKAIAQKRKTEADKEEKRRQEILSRRREQIQHATEKYQRLNKPRAASAVSYHERQSSTAPVPALEDALRLVRGSRAGGSGDIRLASTAGFADSSGYYQELATRQYRQDKSSYKQLQRQNSNSSLQGNCSPQHKQSTGYGGYHGPIEQTSNISTAGNTVSHGWTGQNGSIAPHSSPAHQTRQGSASSSRQYVGDSSRQRNPTGVVQNGLNGYTPAPLTHLQSSSLANMNNSRSLFEEHLASQQQLLVDQQMLALDHFNAEIAKELDSDMRMQGEEDQDDHAQLCESVSSIDSLESGNRPRKNIPNSNANNTSTSNYMSPDGITNGAVSKVSAVEDSKKSSPNRYSSKESSPGSSFGSQTNVAVVAPSVQRPKTESSRKEDISKSQIPDYKSFNSASVSNGAAHTGSVVHHVQAESPAPWIWNPESPPGPGDGADPGGVIPMRAWISPQNKDRSLEKTAPYGSPEKTAPYRSPEKTAPYKEHAAQHGATTPSKDTNANYANHINQESNAHNKDINSNYANHISTHGGTPHSKGVNTNYPNNVSVIIDSFAQVAASTHHTTEPTVPVSTGTMQPLLSTGATQTVTGGKPSTYANIAASSCHVVGSTHTVTTTSTIPLMSTTVSGSAARGPKAVSSVATSAVTHPIFTVADTTKSAARQNVQQKVESEDESVQDEEPPLPSKPIKGILKKKPSGKPRGVKGVAFGRGITSAGRDKGVTAGGVNVRDSLEVARNHLHGHPVSVTRKKGVRFADLDYTEEDEHALRELQAMKTNEQKTSAGSIIEVPCESTVINDEEEHESKGYQPTQENLHQANESAAQTKEHVSVTKEKQETSPNAKVQSSKSKIPTVNHSPTGKPPVQSTDTKPAVSKSRRPVSAHIPNASKPAEQTSKNQRVSSAPVVRRGPFLRPHPPNQPPSGRAIARTTLNRNMVRENGLQQLENSQVKLKEAVFDMNGVRLDRTPTDDEINYLWDKVRTCLSRDSSAGTPQTPQYPDERRPGNPQLSHQNFDGGSLGLQRGVSTRVADHQSNTTSSYMPPKKVDNVHSYSKRLSLLQQRRQTHRPPQYKMSATPAVTTTYQPVNSAPPHITSHGNHHMTGRAGTMTEQTHTDSSVPSALSMEEQRLMHSLERLDERLKSNEMARATGSIGMLNPKPPVYRHVKRGRPAWPKSRR